MASLLRRRPEPRPKPGGRAYDFAISSAEVIMPFSACTAAQVARAVRGDLGDQELLERQLHVDLTLPAVRVQAKLTGQVEAGGTLSFASARLTGDLDLGLAQASTGWFCWRLRTPDLLRTMAGQGRIDRNRAWPDPANDVRGRRGGNARRGQHKGRQRGDPDGR